MSSTLIYILIILLKLAAGVILWSMIGPGGVIALYLWDLSLTFERERRRKDNSD